MRVSQSVSFLDGSESETDNIKSLEKKSVRHEISESESVSQTVSESEGVSH